MSTTNHMRPKRRLSQEEFEKRIENKGLKIKPLDIYTGRFNSIRWQCDKYENHIWYAAPADILKEKGSGCPYCSGNKILKGFNDLWTTNPEIASMLADKNIGYDISKFTHSKFDFICPNCGNIINKPVKNVTLYGLNCSICSDNVSYPEKFISNMLTQLKLDYVYDKSTKWSNKKRYDFYIESLSIIIECHGEQHYTNINQWHSDSNKQFYNDDYKMKLAIENGIKYYIQLDCRISDMDYIKNSILNSDLKNIIDLSDVDWNKCNVESQESNVAKVMNLWNNGTKNVSEISDIVGISKKTVRKYLNNMTKVGLCDYDGKEQQKLSALRNSPHVKNKI